MCGIAGIVGFTNDYRINEATLQKMTRILQHRGPDDEGIFIHNQAGLGHRRLSIIDLTEAGHQPMCNEDRSVWITFNGEIYNYRDYISELTSKGHIFRSRSDTELIIHAYEEWGIEGCLERLNGMFAFGIWDQNKNEFYLVRDRVGIKPVFYSLQKDHLSFASEIKALLQNPSISNDLDYNVLSHYLTLFYTAAPDSILKEIKQMEAGHYLRLKNGKISVKQYWDITLHPEPVYHEEKIIIEQFHEYFKQSVKYTLVADVSIGHLLSSGIDSNAVLYYMKQLYQDNEIKTFTVDSQEMTFSEGSIAAEMAAHFNTNHSNYIITPEATINDINTMVWHQDHLNGNSAVIGLHFVYKMLKEQNVKVALMGSGPDEMFAGYETYLADQYYSKLNKPFIKPLFRTIRAALQFQRSSFEFVSTDYKLRKFLEGFEHDPFKAHYWWRTILIDSEKQKLFKNPGDIKTDSYYTYEKYFQKTANKGYSFLDRCLYADFKMFLGNNAMLMADSASMTHSIEGRPSILNHEFVEFAFKIPGNMKIRNKNLKYIMRAGMKGKLSESFLKLPKKGMNLPLSFWIEKQMKELVEDELSESRTSEIGIFNYSYIRKLLDDHYKHKSNNMYKIWNLFIFYRWHDLFIKQKAFNQSSISNVQSSIL